MIKRIPLWKTWILTCCILLGLSSTMVVPRIRLYCQILVISLPPPRSLVRLPFLSPQIVSHPAILGVTSFSCSLDIWIMATSTLLQIVSHPAILGVTSFSCSLDILIMATSILLQIVSHPAILGVTSFSCS